MQNKKNKYILFGLGLTTLLTGLLSPLIYYEIKAQKYIQSNEYGKAGNIYHNISFFSSKYLDRAASAYVKHFVNELKNENSIYTDHIFISNPILDRNSNSGKLKFIVKDKQSKAYQISKLFTDIEKYAQLRYSKAFSITRSENIVKNIIDSVSKIDIQYKKYFEECIKALEIQVYAEHTSVAVNNGKINDALNYLTQATNKYNSLRELSSTSSIQKLIQINMGRIYHTYDKPFSLNEEMTIFEKRILKLLRTIQKHNKELVKKTNSSYSLSDFLPFKTEAEIKKIYSDYIKEYQDNKKDFSYLNNKLKYTFQRFSYTLQDEYKKMDHNFAALSNIYLILYNRKLNGNEKAQQLSILANTFSTNKQRPIDEITAMFSIKSYHEYGLYKTKKEDYVSAGKYFDSAFEVYEQYKDNSQSIFTTYYRSICKRHSDELLRISKKHPRQKYLKEIANSILEKLNNKSR